jgi:hypothetical protein
MKSIKFIFAFLLVSTVFISCSSDSIAADDELYTPDTVFATGDDGTADIMRTRD